MHHNVHCTRNAHWYVARMSAQLAVRFSDEEIRQLDEIVSAGDAESRSAALRIALAAFVDGRRIKQLVERDRRAYERDPQKDVDHVWSTAAAISMIEAEDWSAWYPSTSELDGDVERRVAGEAA
jgi:Arc/MetJ-type ribon-helix-helix transcriptional regulator